MNDAISVELQFFLISILCGAILLFVYDVLRILRRLIRHNGFFVALEDLLFWTLAALFIFAMIYTENDGIIRGFSVMGMAIGMVLYHYILSDVIIELTTKLIRAFFRPVLFILKKLKKFLIILHNKYRKLVNFITIRLKKCLKSIRIILDKRKQTKLQKRQKHQTEKLQKRRKEDELKQAKKEQKEKQQQKKRNKKPKNQKKSKKTDKGSVIKK